MDQKKSTDEDVENLLMKEKIMFFNRNTELVNIKCYI